MVLVVKDLPADTGNIRDASWISGGEDPLEDGMATVHGVTKGQT